MISLLGICQAVTAILSAARIGAHKPVFFNVIAPDKSRVGFSHYLFLKKAY